MAKIAAALRKLIENPDDLSTLPQLVAQAEELEGSIDGYQERIGKMQDLNKKYLAQIPVPGDDPEEVEEDADVTIADAKQQIIDSLGGH